MHLQLGEIHIDAVVLTTHDVFLMGRSQHFTYFTGMCCSP